jgi:hypothetical protein
MPLAASPMRPRIDAGGGAIAKAVAYHLNEVAHELVVAVEPIDANAQAMYLFRDPPCFRASGGDYRTLTLRLSTPPRVDAIVAVTVPVPRTVHVNVWVSPGFSQPMSRA